jgi:hypothetical protein
MKSSQFPERNKIIDKGSENQEIKAWVYVLIYTLFLEEKELAFPSI